MTAPVQPPVAPFAVDKVRADFPILATQVHGKPLVYLDNAATTQKPRAVIDALSRYYETTNANIHRGVHSLSQRATDEFEAGREAVRRFLNAGSSREIIFTRGTTESINLVAQTYARTQLKAGDEVLIGEAEHHANIVPWQQLRDLQGIVLKVAPVNEAGELDMAAFERLLTARTRLVAIGHVSNALGSINPVAQIIELAHARGAKVLVDGAQSVAHGPVDVTALDCDFFAFSGHKLFGPTGIGVLYGKAEHLNAMPPFLGGGEMISQVTQDNVTYADPPFRFEPGTMPIVQAIGLGAAIDFMLSLDRAAVAAHEKSLLDYATARLSEINALTIYGQAREKGAIISFGIDGIHPHDIATIIDQSGVAVRSGQHCAEPLMRHLGVTATARASFALYNTKEEVDILVRALEDCRKLFG